MTNEPIEITSEQWETMKPYVRMTSYGSEAQFFESVDAIKTAPKVVTLNGSPLRQVTDTSRVYRTVEERITAGNQVVKLPNGMFAVMSKTLAQKAGFGRINPKTAKLPEGL